MGPASNIDARMFPQSIGSGVWLSIDFACTVHVWLSSSVIVTPRVWSSFLSVSTSPINGMLRSTTGSSVSRHAARIGKAAFLLPDGVRVPFNGVPPLIINCSISLGICR